MSAFSCMTCWPALCKCASPMARSYLDWAGAGFWFEGTVMRRDDGLLVQICEDGKAYVIERYMPEENLPITFIESKQVAA